MPILRMPEVKAECGHRSHASVYAAVRAGLFTVPVPIGQRAVGWPDTEVKAINAARIAGKSDDEIRALVGKLHEARMAGTGLPFKTDWFDRSKAQKQQIAQRKVPLKAMGTSTGVAA
jgi:prophage regulatory protein